MYLENSPEDEHQQARSDAQQDTDREGYGVVGVVWIAANTQQHRKSKSK